MVSFRVYPFQCLTNEVDGVTELAWLDSGVWVPIWVFSFHQEK